MSSLTLFFLHFYYLTLLTKFLANTTFSRTKSRINQGLGICCRKLLITPLPQIQLLCTAGGATLSIHEVRAAKMHKTSRLHVNAWPRAVVAIGKTDKTLVLPWFAGHSDKIFSFKWSFITFGLAWSNKTQSLHVNAWPRAGAVIGETNKTLVLPWFAGRSKFFT